MLWGAVASGYWIYGWRQKAGMPLAAGGAIMLASFMFPALWMTVICVGIMVGTWWLMKQGY